MNRDIGCTDPHGMYPFPKDRESCPKCQAIRRPTMKRGLPYGWWKSADVWAGAIVLFILCPMVWLLLAAWFLDWKPVW